MKTNHNREKIQPELLKQPEAIHQLVLFLRLDSIKAGQDIMKSLGDNSLKDGEHWNKDVDTRTDTFSHYSRHYNPCHILQYRENYYSLTLVSLSKEIEQYRLIAGKRGLKIILERLK